jgi:hypothetical protein
LLEVLNCCVRYWLVFACFAIIVSSAVNWGAKAGLDFCQAQIQRVAAVANLLDRGSDSIRAAGDQAIESNAGSQH